MKEIKFYSADIYTDINPRISLGKNFLGNEEYLGIFKKSNWENPILVTIKNNKLQARPIIIDKEEDSYYLYSANIDINSILSNEDIQYLNRVINQSINANVPLIELSDKLEIDENIIFNHAVQVLDENALKAFSQEKQKNNSIDINEFIRKTHENSDIKKVDTDIENLISSRKETVASTNMFDVFATIRPVSAKEIRETYANNGFYNVDEEQISDIVKKVNDELAKYLIETFKTRVVNDVSKTRIKNNNYKDLISEDEIKNYTNQISSFNDEIASQIVMEILETCNDKDRIKNLFEANNLKKQYESERNKELDISYTLAIAEKLNEVSKAQSEKKPIHNTILTENNVKSFSDTPNNINFEDVQYVSNDLNDTISSIIASEIKMDIVFDLQEQYNSGVPFTALTADDLKVKYNISDKIAQQLSIEINEMIMQYIEDKEQSKENNTPYILDGFENESGKHK